MAERFKTNDSEFSSQATNLVAYLTANKDRFKLSADEIQEISDSVTPFPPALTAFDESSRAYDVASNIKATTRKTAQQTLGTTVTNLGNLFTNEDRIANGMEPLSDSRTRHAAPTEQPYLMIDYGASGVLMVTIYDLARPGKTGKPADVADAELRWEIVDEAFSEDEDDWHAGPTPSDLRSPIAVRFKPTYKGKTIALKARYRNTGGEGPWSEAVQKLLV